MKEKKVYSTPTKLGINQNYLIDEFDYLEKNDKLSERIEIILKKEDSDAKIFLTIFKVGGLNNSVLKFVKGEKTTIPITSTNKKDKEFIEDLANDNILILFSLFTSIIDNEEDYNYILEQFKKIDHSDLNIKKLFNTLKTITTKDGRNVYGLLIQKEFDLILKYPKNPSKKDGNFYLSIPTNNEITYFKSVLNFNKFNENDFNERFIIENKKQGNYIPVLEDNTLKFKDFESNEYHPIRFGSSWLMRNSTTGRIPNLVSEIKGFEERVINMDNSFQNTNIPQFNIPENNINIDNKDVDNSSLNDLPF